MGALPPAIDAHTHLDLPAFDADRAAVLQRARDVGIAGCVICAADPTRWDDTEAIARAHGLPFTLGVHPWWEAALSGDAVDALLGDLAARPTPHGIGETGLDFARATTPDARQRQAATTRAHLALARDRDVPVVLHVVRAYPQLLALLSRDPLPAAGGMVHSWSGDVSFVAPAVRRGLSLSFSPAILRSDRLRAACAAVPDDRLLIETDAPDQPATPGTRGEPADLWRVAHAVADARGQTVDHVVRVTADNARRLFPGVG